jgi:hypothetical protein
VGAFARFASDGSLIWVKSAGSAGFDDGTAVVALGDGTLVWLGTLTGAALFGQGEARQTSLSAGAFAARTTALGQLIWAANVGNGPVIACGTGSGAITLGSFPFTAAGIDGLAMRLRP